MKVSHQCGAFHLLHLKRLESRHSSRQRSEPLQPQWSSSLWPSLALSHIRHYTRPPQHRPASPSGQVANNFDQPSPYNDHLSTHATVHQPSSASPQCVQCNFASRVLRLPSTVSGALPPNLLSTYNGQMHLPQAKGPLERPVGLSPLKACDTLKVMLITIALCLTVSSSSCQTLYSVIESPQSRPLEPRSKAPIASTHVVLPSSYENHRVPITYTPAHINKQASMPPVRSQHANRLKKRPQRSSKLNQSRHQQQQSKQFRQSPGGRSAPAATWPARPMPGKPSLPPPSPSSSSHVPSPFLSFSPMLSSSILAAQMKPPYVSGSLSHHSSSASANIHKIDSQQQSSAKNITAQVGHPVYLHCIVESLGDKMVSWIRLRDFHLLTIGSLTYIQDDRFAVRPASHSTNDWSLQIKHVSVKDEGLYECQINSDPPRSQYYYLHVVVPVSEILGNPDIFVRLGEPINLTCLITSPLPPAFVFWYHNDRVVNYDSKGQISVQKDPNRSDVVISRLLIKKARLDDSGNYTCTPSNAEPASSYVHVLQGEKRMSNQIQNDWSQTDQLAANNEGHHSGGPSSRLLPAAWSAQLATTMLLSTVCILHL